MNRTRTVAKKITYFIFSTLLLVMLILPQIRITESSAVSSKTITISQNAQSITWGGFSKTSLPTFTYSSTAIFDKSLTTFNGNDTFTFKIKANTSTSQRTGYIYAKNSSGTIIATLTIKQAAHTHSYTSWKVTAIPTCTTPGSQYSICSCGNKRTAIIYPTGHSCRITKSTAATCTKKGTITHECFKCTYSTTTSTPALGHNYLPKNISGHIDLQCTRCYSISETYVSYNEFIKTTNRSDDNNNKLHYLRAVYANDPSVTDEDMMNFILTANGYSANIDSQLDIFCEALFDACDVISKSGYQFNLFGYDNLAKLSEICGYHNTFKQCSDLFTNKENIYVSDWILCMDALEDITKYAGKADIFYSTIIKELKPYLAGTIKAVQEEDAKTYLTEISSCILKDEIVVTMDHCTPMGVFTNMEFWLKKCEARTGKKTCFEMYDALYNASIAYQKYIKVNAIKEPNENSFAHFIASEDYFNKYYNS